MRDNTYRVTLRLSDVQVVVCAQRPDLAVYYAVSKPGYESATCETIERLVNGRWIDLNRPPVED